MSGSNDVWVEELSSRGQCGIVSFDDEACWNWECAGVVEGCLGLFRRENRLRFQGTLVAGCRTGGGGGYPETCCSLALLIIAMYALEDHDKITMGLKADFCQSEMHSKMIEMRTIISGLSLSDVLFIICQCRIRQLGSTTDAYRTPWAMARNEYTLFILHSLEEPTARLYEAKGENGILLCGAALYYRCARDCIRDGAALHD